jgi:hypothetical protein
VGAEGLPSLTATCTCQHHIDSATAAAGANEPVTPSENRGSSAVEPSLFRGVGLGLVLTGLAPHDEAQMGSGGAADRRRRPRRETASWEHVRRGAAD